MEKRDLVTRVDRSTDLLKEFNYSIEHHSGAKMSYVDAFSRSTIDIMCVLFYNILPKIKLAQESNNEVKVIKNFVRL